MNVRDMFALVMAACVILSTGCANLKEKSVAMGGGVQGFKFSVAADPNSGTILPELATGFGDFFFLDIPMDGTKDLEFFHQEKSLWSNVAASTLYIKIRSGKDACTVKNPPALKLEMDIIGDNHAVIPPNAKLPGAK